VTWAIESNLDDLAEKAGIDRYEIRRINCNEAGEVTPMSLEITSCGLDACLEATARGLDWEAPRPPRVAEDGGKRLRGVGMASLIHVGGSGRIYRSDASGLIFKLDDFGNVNVSYGGVEMGQGLHATLIMAVAESLGVRPERVHINPTDTGTCPWDVGTHASRGAFMACSAAVRLAAKVRARLFEEARTLFPAIVAKQRARHARKHPDLVQPDVDVAALAAGGAFDLQDDRLSLAGMPDAPWATVAFGRLLRAMHFRRDGTMITDAVFYDPPSDLPDWGKGMGNMSAAYTYGTQGVEVEVDEDTGEVKILKMVSALDIGKVLNPPSLEGQTYGGIAQGIGYALYEQVQTHEGRVLNPGFTDYKIPTIAEMDFPIEMVFVETNDPNGPYGAKGAGEPGLVPTAPAIGNAIRDAIGVRLYDLPLTPEKILAAIRRRKAELTSVR